MDSVRHFEFSAPDRVALGTFYSDLFGWHTEAFEEMSYVTIDTHAGKGINGGIGPVSEGMAPTTTLYVAVDDLQATLDKAESLGGKTIMPPMDIPDVVSLAIFMDVQGCPVGIIKNAGDPEGVSEGSNPGVTWFEILGPDPSALKEFYGQLFGWEFSEGNPESQIEYYEVRGDDLIGGGVGSSPDGQTHVTAYAEVDDLQANLDKAESLGAQTIVPPMDMADVSFAQFLDPAGIAFGLFKRT